MTKIAPGPKELPFIGSVYQFASEGPEFLVRMAATYGEITRFHLFKNTVHLIADPELVREVLVTKANLFRKSDRDIQILDKFVGLGLVTTNGEQHKRQRKLTQPAFHARRIMGYSETMVNYAEKLGQRWHDGQQIEMSDEMMSLTMFIVCKSLFNADWETMAQVATRVGGAIEVLQSIADSDFTQPVIWPQWLPTPSNRRGKAAQSILTETMQQIVDERRAASPSGQIEDTGDLLSMLLMSHYEDGDVMDNDEIRDQLVTLFVAGHETTSNALTWTWYLLSQHPDTEAKMHREIDTVLGGRLPTLADLPNLPYTEMVLKESMRIYPPAWVLNLRQANEETYIGEYRIGKDEMVFISPYLMHRQPQFFPEPERFDPERFTPENEEKLPRYAYLPFGAGPRVCIGNAFAMMEAHLILATIAQRFRFELDPAQVIELNPQVTLSSLHGMAMKVIERYPSTAAKATVDKTMGHRKPITGGPAMEESNEDHKSNATPGEHREPELAIR